MLDVNVIAVPLRQDQYLKVHYLKSIFDSTKHDVDNSFTCLIGLKAHNALQHLWLAPMHHPAT